MSQSHPPYPTLPRIFSEEGEDDNNNNNQNATQLPIQNQPAKNNLKFVRIPNPNQNTIQPSNTTRLINPITNSSTNSTTITKTASSTTNTLNNTVKNYEWIEIYSDGSCSPNPV